MNEHNDYLMQRQFDLESEMVNRGADRYAKEFQRGVDKDRFGETYPGTVLTKLGIEPFALAIGEWIREAYSGKRGRRNRSAVLIHGMDPYVVSYIAIRSIFAMLYRRNTLTNLGSRVGKAIMDEARFIAFDEKAPGLWRTVNETAARNMADTERRRTTLIYTMNKFGIEFDEWSPNDKLHLGVKLIEMFAEISGFITITTEPAPRRGVIHVVQPTQALIEFVEEQNLKGEINRPMYLPTVIPPVDRTSNAGSPYHYGLINVPTPLVKNKPENGVSYPEQMPMPLVYRGVNAIQSTPWRVNKKVFRVLQAMWEGNYDLPGIPSKENLKIPPYPEGASEEAKKAWRLSARQIHDANAKSKGVRLLVSMTLGLASKFAEDEAFYFPHHLDFRGRCYSTVPTLSPQGAEHGKAIIELARGKPLGSFDAVRWLAIQGANVYGYDKVSLDDRVQWVFEHEEEILWCAEDPLKFDWWHQADKPFSFLAFCFEWQGYKRYGIDHVTHLPIALDGTCNGLQHFSAMLRDSVGGAAVNLLPAEEPNDIYATVAEETKAILREGPYRDGKEELWAEAWLAFGIDRNLTKRPVMVLPYGGTFRSCLEYIGDEVRKRIAKGEHDPFGTDLPQAIGYLSRCVWQSINVTVVAAREAMSWLQKVARMLAKHGRSIEWTAPSGFRVRQRYMSTELRRVRTKLFGAITYLSFQEKTDEVDVHKNASAMSPNFVHSMDAAAMMMTIDLALDAGIKDFAMIHDSYGTLATDTEELSRLIRKAFVKLYTEHDVLQELRDDVYFQLPEEDRDNIPPLPAKGNLIIDDVMRSDFFFS